MKCRSLLWLALLLLPILGSAQTDADAALAELQAQRARIESQRQQEVARYAEQHKACEGRFAVNDCRKAVKSRERESLAELRRQDVALNVEQRRIAAQRRGEATPRSPAQPAAPASAAATSNKVQQPSAPMRAARDAQANQGGAKPQARTSMESRRAQKDAERQAGENKAAARRSAHEQLLLEAARHEQELAARREKRNRPGAQPLPAVPENAASGVAAKPNR